MASFDYDVAIIGFDIATGAVLKGPATEALTVYEVQETEAGMQLRA